MTTAIDLTAFLRGRVASLTGTVPEAVSIAVPLRELGVDSTRAVELMAALSTRLGRPVPNWMVFQHPTITALATHLTGAAAEPVAVTTGGGDEPIAIVGLGCRLPGGVDSAGELWESLLDERDAVGEVPADRWSLADWYDEDREAPGRMSTRWGGFLDDVRRFDADFFRLSPAEAERMDPQQRISLEVAWAALEDARVLPGALAGSRTGVFFGAMWQEYQLATGADPTAIGSHSAVGWDTSIIPARIAYTLGLRGPVLAIGSACSSSLAAVHLAARSLREGESDLALAGGVSLMLTPHTTVAMSKFGGMSPDGQCRAFDADAAGYVRGEGCGVIVLRRLSDALRNGDRVYAVLHGSAVNNDGASNGLTAPNPAAQIEVVRSAWQDAGVAPNRVSYVEAHGTGTPLGDPVEAAALGAVFAPDRTEPLLIGSAKTNFGHLEPAAGVLGVLKTALALHHGTLPASLHFDRPNPDIDFDEQRLAVVTGVRPWPDGARYAGVSGFGFGGTNVHVALGEAPGRWPALAQLPSTVAAERPMVVFCFSGHGSQWIGMGRDLLTEPAFRTALTNADRAVAAVTGWSVIEELVARDSRLGRTEVIQPVLFAIQVALAGTLTEWGLTADVVMGQSIGEVAAAVTAGALTLEQGAHVIGVWSALIAERASGHGGMIVCALPPCEAKGYGLTVAGYLAPRLTCLSGPLDALVDAERVLADADVRSDRVAIDYASHNTELTALTDELVTRLGDLRPAGATIPFLSTVTGNYLTGAELDASYWAANTTRPMLLTDAMARLDGDRPLRVVEIGPHPVLCHALDRTLESRVDARVLPTCHRERPTGETLRELLITLRRDGVDVSPGATTVERVTPLVLSAPTEAGLAAQATQLSAYLDTRPDLAVADVGYSLATTRTTFEHRAVVLGRTRPELLAALPGLDTATTGVVTVPADDAGPVLVFPGAGAQWVGMARELLASAPVFATRFGECVAALAEFVDWSPVDALADEDALFREDVVQPLQWAIMVSLAELWAAHGVRPVAVVGHSQGEIAAACVAGALSLADGARLVALRSKVIARSLAGRGGLVSLGLSRADAEARIAPWADVLSLAAANGARSTVVSGELGALAELLAGCEADDVRARRVLIDYASHSAQVEAIRDELAEVLAPIVPRRAETGFFSTVDGCFVDTTELDAAYWYRNLRQPVEFAAAIEALSTAGHHVFIEVSSHPVLIMAIEETADDVVAVGTLRRGAGGYDRFLTSLANAHVRGVAVDWTPAYPHARVVDLPTHAFQHRRYWLDANPRHTGADAEFWTTVDSGDPTQLAAALGIDPAALTDVLPALVNWRGRHQDSAAVQDWRYEITWLPVPESVDRPAQPLLALLPQETTVVAEVRDGLLSRGVELVPYQLDPIRPREAVAAELSDLAQQDFAGVVSLLALTDTGGGHDTVPAEYAGTVLAVQALGDAGIGAPLWCLTRGAVVTGQADLVVEPAQRMVWGLGRVVALEHADRWGGLVDLPAEPDVSTWSRLVGIIAGRTGEDQVAIRSRGVLGRRLMRAGTAPGTTWRPGGTVLVTGGTGALGRRVARWLAERGAQRLVLASRSGADAEGLADLDTDVKVEMVSCDVADRDALAALLDRIGPLSAVVHAAGVADNALLSKLTPEQIERVLRAKVRGALNLHELTRDHDLSAFVLFSSWSATVGVAGHGNYAPANAFLDGLAELRRAAGLPATSVSWGAWAGGGMVADTTSLKEVLDREGMASMDPARALVALQQAIDSGRAGQTVADIRWPRFMASFRPSPLLTEIADAATAAEAAPAERLTDLSPRERAAATLDLVLRHTANVLGYPAGRTPDAGSAFKELGLDSVTAVELRNRLGAATGLKLPVTLVFEQPTPARVVEFLLTELGEPADELDALESAVAALPAGVDTERLRAVAERLTALVTRGNEDTAAGHERECDLADASDDEVFEFLDTKYGLARSEG